MGLISTVPPWRAEGWQGGSRTQWFMEILSVVGEEETRNPDVSEPCWHSFLSAGACLALDKSSCQRSEARQNLLCGILQCASWDVLRVLLAFFQSSQSSRLVSGCAWRRLRTVKQGLSPRKGIHLLELSEHHIDLWIVLVQ